MLFIPVWPEQIRYVTHPPDPRYTGATFETRYPPTPTAPAPSQPVYRESGVHLPFLTYEQQQQIYGTTPQVIRQMLPRPVEPTTYTKFEYLSTLGYQRERLELRKDLFDKDVYKPSIDWYTSTEKLVRGTPSGTVFRKTDTGVEYFSPIKEKPLVEPGPSLGGFLSFFFREDYIDYFKTQFFGEQPFVIDPKKGKLDWKWETPFESPATKEARIAAEVRGRKAWGSGDWPYLSIRVLKSPLVSIPVSHVAFKGLSLGVRAISPGVKRVVRGVPKVYGRTVKVFPRVFDTSITESGKIVSTRPASLVSRLGRTDWWGNISGWGTDKLVRVRQLSLIDVVPGKPLGEGFKGKVRLYEKFLPKSEWVPKTIGTRYKELGMAGLRYTDEGLESSSIFEISTKPSGFLWKRMARQVVEFDEFEPFVFEARIPTTVMFKAPGFVGRFSTPGISSPGVSPKTLWSKTVGEYMTTEFKPARTVQEVQRFWFSPEKPWHQKVLGITPKKQPVSFMKAESAVSSILRPVPITKVIPGFKSDISKVIPSRTIFIPTGAFLPEVSIGNIPLVSTGIISTSITVQKPELETRQLVSRDIVEAQISGQSVRQIQKQELAQVQLQRQLLVLKTVTPTKPVTTFPKPFPSYSPTVIVPFRIPLVFGLPFELKGRGKMKYDERKREGLAFRFREWKPGVYKYVSPFKPFNNKGGLRF